MPDTQTPEDCQHQYQLGGSRACVKCGEAMDAALQAKLDGANPSGNRAARRAHERRMRKARNRTAR